MSARALIRQLAHDDSRSGFDCGNEALNEYLEKYASQDVKRNLARCFVLIDGEGEIVGYYTLSATSIPLLELPGYISKKLRYRTIPAAILGRLAIDKKMQGRGYGKALLSDAVQRTSASDTACHLLLVDAKDETSRDFYISFGFTVLPHENMKLFFVL